MKLDWDRAFRESEKSIAIQNVNPSPGQGSRNIFKDDCKEIMAAALKHGFKQLDTGKVVSFARVKVCSYCNGKGYIPDYDSDGEEVAPFSSCSKCQSERKL